MMGTLNCHNITVTLQAYQAFHLGITSDSESISPALVQVKVTAGVKERQKQGNDFACGGHRQLLSPYPPWRIPPSVLVTIGSMRQYLLPNQFAQVVQLLQDCTSVRAVARRLALSPSTVSRACKKYQETSCDTRRAGQLCSRALNQQQDLYLLQMTSHGQLVCVFLTKLSETDSKRGLMSCSGTCAHSPAACSSIGICERTPEPAGPPWARCSLRRWKQVHTEDMWQAWKCLEMPWWKLCCL